MITNRDRFLLGLGGFALACAFVGLSHYAGPLLKWSSALITRLAG
jgi:hypothetical protein